MKQGEVEEEFHNLFEFEFSNSKWRKTLVHVEFIFAKLSEDNFPSCPTEESTEKDIDIYRQTPKKVCFIFDTLKVLKFVQEEGRTGKVESEMVIK